MPPKTAPPDAPTVRRVSGVLLDRHHRFGTLPSRVTPGALDPVGSLVIPEVLSSRTSASIGRHALPFWWSWW